MYLNLGDLSDARLRLALASLARGYSLTYGIYVHEYPRTVPAPECAALTLPF